MAFTPTKSEVRRYTSGMKEHMVRFGKAFWPTNWMDLSHAYVNIFVESARLDPYIHGHLEVYAQVALILLLVAL